MDGCEHLRRRPGRPDHRGVDLRGRRRSRQDVRGGGRIGGRMTKDEMLGIVDRFTKESWNGGNLDLLEEFFAPDYIGHDAPRPEPVHGPVGMREFLRTYQQAM